MEWIAWLYGVDCLFMGLISFLAYGIDKRRSQTRGNRIPERTLHWIDLAGGWIGGWMGRRLFRHKTRDTRFLILARAIMVIHCVIIFTLGFVSVGGGGSYP